MLTYKAHKMDRMGTATLLCEANAMSEGLANAEWVASWLGLARSPKYDLRQRAELNRELQVTSLMREPQDERLKLVSVTDAKSLFDNLSREAFTGAERRAALEVCVIRDSLDSLGGKARWIPHNRNPVDCMTKMHGNAKPLLQLLQEKRFAIQDEEQEMAERREFRATTGKSNPRDKSG